MTETSWLAIIAVSNTLTALLAFATLIIGKWTRDDVKTLEINTNSIREALVTATAEASEAKGRDAQRLIGEAKAAAVQQGRNEAKLEPKGATTSGPAPVPVTDAQATKAAESTARSTAKLAEATVQIAEATKKK